MVRSIKRSVESSVSRIDRKKEVVHHQFQVDKYRKKLFTKLKIRIAYLKQKLKINMLDLIVKEKGDVRLNHSQLLASFIFNHCTFINQNHFDEITNKYIIT